MTVDAFRRVPPGIATVLAIALTAAACAGHPPAADVSRARADLDRLAGTIGARPIGSPADEAAREFVADELRAAGFAVRVQSVDAVNQRNGITAPVSNVIAVRDGSSPDAIALVAHYDSVPDGPGASDDGLGVSTCLESARLLSTLPMRHTLMTILTDGEEVGLMGGRAAASDPDIRRRVRAFLNFDGTGASGVPVLFQAGPGGAPLTAWARGATAPFGGSVGIEIYKRLPNDTDFTELETTGASGLNFAPVVDSYAYHTDRDTAGRVNPSTLAREIATTVSTVHALDGTDLASTSTPQTFFDLASRRGVAYGRAMTMAVAAVAAVSGAIAWLLVVRLVVKARRVTGLLLGWIWALASTAAAFGAMVAVVWILRRVRHEITPWYASPYWLFGAMAGAGALALWCCDRIAAPFAARVRSSAPVMVWAGTLPVWIGLTVFLAVEAPGASYLAALPLAAAGILFTIWRQRLWVRLVSVAVLAVVVVLWIRNLAYVLLFLVPLLGWLPIVGPVWLYPAVLTLAGLVLWPPFAAATAGATRTRSLLVASAALPLVVLGGCGAAAWWAPAYTTDRPARRVVHYVQDNTRGEAWWEIAGPENSTGIDRLAFANARWQRETSAPPATTRADGFRLPFVFRALTPPLLTTAPADVTTVWSENGRQGHLDLTISPRQLLAARLILPAHLAPSSSTLAGAVNGTEWTATLVAVPSTGFTAHLVFESTSQAPADRMLVALITTGVPGGAASGGLPAWLPTVTDTWQARTTMIVAPTPRVQTGSPPPFLERGGVAR